MKATSYKKKNIYKPKNSRLTSKIIILLKQKKEFIIRTYIILIKRDFK